MKTKDRESENTVVRAVTLPVAAPVDLSWAELDAAILPAFRLSTDLANWCVRRLFVLDDPASAKTPDAVKKWYGYKDAGENYPDAAKWGGAMASFNIVTRTVQRKYVQQRFDVMVRHDSSLLTYRFPQPYPVHNASWHLAFNELQQPILSLALPGVGRVAVRLHQGREFGRQLAMLRQILDGTAKKGEAALYRDRKGNLLAKMVGHFPRREPDRTPANACFLHTDPAALLVAEVNGRSVTITNGDHIRRWWKKGQGRPRTERVPPSSDRVPDAVAEHKAFLQRASEDKKREVRMDRRHRANFDKAIAARCLKQNSRVDTAVHQVTAQVVRFCERQRVGVVVYDDANREFMGRDARGEPIPFPWHAVGERLADKLRAVGITMLARASLDAKEFEQWRSDPTLVRATALAGSRLVAAARRAESHPSVTVAPRRSRRTAPTCPTRNSARSSRSAATSPSGRPATPDSSSGALPRPSAR